MNFLSKALWFLTFSKLLIRAASQKVSQAANSESLDQHRVLQVLKRYEIGSPAIQFAGTIVNVVFPLSDQVPDGSVSTKTFSDTECSVDISRNDFLISTILYDENPSMDGTTLREVTVRYDIDPLKIQQSDVWIQNDNVQFFLQFCMSIHLHTGNASTTPALSSVDTVVLVQVDLRGNFTAEPVVEPNDPNSSGAQKAYYVEGFLCDENNERKYHSVPLVQGSSVRVCVKPTDETLEEGVYMKSIDSFTYQQTNSQNTTTYTQVAVHNGESANSTMTTLTCDPGSELCHFTTILQSNFYVEPGTVIGFGDASLQFGAGSVRKLQFALKDDTYRSKWRELEEEGEDAAGGFREPIHFSFSFFTVPNSDFQYGAIAYECDSKNQKVSNPIPKKLGDAIRICVMPDEVSRGLGITINRIDSWNWTRGDGASQTAVDVGGVEAEGEGLTILLCLPGSEICIFGTQFSNDFYTSEEIVYGAGNVVLQFGTDAPATTTSRCLHQITSGNLANDRMLQSSPELAFPGIAGTVDVRVNTWVMQAEGILPISCKRASSSVSAWYQELPVESRIGVLVGFFALLVSSGLLCWFFPCIKCDRGDDNNQEEEIQDIEAPPTMKCIEYHETTRVATRSIIVRPGSETLTYESSNGSSREYRTGNLLALPPSSTSWTQPGDHDVCFDERSRAGTKKLLRVIRAYVKESPDESYGPHSFRQIKNSMDMVQFFLCAGDGRYVEATHQETVTMIGHLYANVKRGKVKRLKGPEQVAGVENNRKGKKKRHSPKLLKNDDNRSVTGHEGHGLETTSKMHPTTENGASII